MTTIVCNRTMMVADRRITPAPKFLMDKIYRVGESLFGLSGPIAQCLQFIEWVKTQDKRPEFIGSVDFAILELSTKGICYWDEALIPIPIESEFYAVGSGAGFALGALSNGASLRKSILIASRWDETTGPEVQAVSLKVK